MLKSKTYHIGLKLPNITYDIISSFLLEFNDFHVFNRIDSSIISNIDETSIFLNMPYTTTKKKRKKNIIINTQNQEKCGITVLLVIVADSFKLPPLIIFKHWKM